MLSYPVVYCQDGEDFFNFGRIADLCEQIIMKRIWSPSSSSASTWTKKYVHLNIPRTGNVLNHIPARSSKRLFPSSSSIIRYGPTGPRPFWRATRWAAPYLFIWRFAIPNASARSSRCQVRYYPYSQELIARETDLSWLHLFMIVGLQETAFKTDRGVFDFVALNRSAKQLLEDRAPISSTASMTASISGASGSSISRTRSAFSLNSPLYLYRQKRNS